MISTVECLITLMVEDRGLHTRGRGNLLTFAGLNIVQQELLLDRTGIPLSVLPELQLHSQD